jgi:1,2-diacylglycerol 3-alpha-glucosyltransferase
MNNGIGVLFSSYGPYHLARIKALSSLADALLKQPVTAIELARSQDQYPWETNIDNLCFSIVSVIPDQSLEDTNIFRLLWELNAILNEYNPNVLAIAGYFQPSMLFALAWCLWHRKPAILLSETTELDVKRSWWKETVKRWIVSRFKAALVGGQPHKRYLTKLGMSPDSIFLGYDVVGNDEFSPNRIHSLPRPVAKPFFLSINRFVPKKNLEFLIAAYADYRQVASCEAWDLVLCGDGQLRPQLERQIAELGLKDYAYLPGFLQQEELLPYFTHAGCFIHASTEEQWGLVVNEAMAAGLPVLVSRRCGCFEDLVLEGINGFGFDPYCQQELSQLMYKISQGGFDLPSMKQASLDHIQKFSPEHFAQGLIHAVEFARAQSGDL